MWEGSATLPPSPGVPSVIYGMFFIPQPHPGEQPPARAGGQVPALPGTETPQPCTGRSSSCRGCARPQFLVGTRRGCPGASPAQETFPRGGIWHPSSPFILIIKTNILNVQPACLLWRGGTKPRLKSFSLTSYFSGILRVFLMGFVSECSRNSLMFPQEQGREPRQGPCCTSWAAVELH